MSRHVGLLARLLGGVLAATSLAANAQDLERGKLLYETNCIACHESMVHIRSDRRALSRTQLQAQVVRWAGVARPEWSAEEIADVVHYLNATYYKFPPEPQQR
jgi:mono/diheme cytochrome c family protein